MEKTLSEKGWDEGLEVMYSHEDVKEAVKKLKEEDIDLEEDVINLIIINNYGKKDLMAKMRRLFQAHNQEKHKIFGDFK